jgi:hypothetical protein
VAGSWRRDYNEELHNLYASPNIIRMIKSRKMRLAWHIARTEEMRNAYSILLEGLKGRGHPEDLGVVANIILERVFGK